MKACLNQGTLNQTDVHAFVEAASSAGFHAIEFRIEKLRSYAASNHSWNQLRQLLKDRHLEPVCVNAFEDFSYVPSQDFEPVLHRAREFSVVCKQIACPIFVACPSPVQKELTKAKALEMTSDRLSKIARVSAEQSVGVAFEFLAEASASTIEDAVDVIRSTGSSNVGLLIDTFHYYVGQSTLDALKDFPLERLWGVHFNDVEPGRRETLTDANRLLPGKGTLKMHEFERWLKDHGWDGWLSVEILRPEYWSRDPLEVARETVASLAPYL